MTTAIQVRVPFLSGGAFPFGTVVDHWIFTYTSGPTALSPVTIPAGQQYVTYPVAAAGSYTVSGQAFDSGGTPIGAPIAVSFSSPSIATTPALVPVSLYFVGMPGGPGSGSVTGRLLFQNIGSLTPGQIIDHAVISLSGPSNVNATVTTPWPSTFTIPSGMVNGNYNWTIQTYDSTSTAYGPPMNNTAGGIGYFDEALTTPPIMLARSPGVVIQGANLANSPGL